LRDDENFAVALRQRSIHLALLVVKNAQISNFPSEPFCVGFSVVFIYAEQDAQSRTYPADNIAVNKDAGLGHSLDDGAHDDSSRRKWRMLGCND
jgi:hypothetical protein